MGVVSIRLHLKSWERVRSPSWREEVDKEALFSNVLGIFQSPTHMDHTTPPSLTEQAVKITSLLTSRCLPNLVFVVALGWNRTPLSHAHMDVQIFDLLSTSACRHVLIQRPFIYFRA